MNSVKRRGFARLTGAALVCGLAAAGAIATAGPAAADDAPQNQGGVTATLGRITAGGGAVVHDRRKTGPVLAGLFEMKVDGGGTLQTYCIDILTNTVDGAKYKEAGWDESSLHDNKNAGKIRWILQHSYPQVNDLAALGKDSGAGTLDANTAAAGTQVAIWRYSDNVNVDARDPAAEKLADYLYKSAQDIEEPKASLTLTPPAVSGKSGQKLGPVTVHTNASSVTVTSTDAAAQHVKIVDKSGKPVTSTANGEELYFDVPAGTPDGSASLKATAATKVPVGRAFIGDHTKTQTLILAGSSESTVTAGATANWAKKGAIPAVSARKDCAKGGVEITADNKGDEAFTFELDGKKNTVKPGGSEKVFVKVAEDQAYKITINGPNGFTKTFTGILDCKTAETGTTGGSGGTPSPSGTPVPASGSRTGGATGGDLATTGSSSATPMIAGIAAALVVVGGAAVFFLRKKKTTGE
ncbi:TQXA domain-containing protein/LPXTG-motif cell wall-anchored protein [Streptomyces olivoverticillatus]|uniref:TQXA domain-containing protein/LPXTG-motif cell wall-anchored protein n=1 Tax=Streptomyces olivoverticillatus TaxID=66427 RepID=A0A7W7PJQ6_9ACTN|nr:Cys-Gln thioester bond-forming surface protein [Streptomyces olivoverticillatus]MBB4892397.1 TQXA domain-containing protein/LPXTG-motif cell wall-anchored protein [Streptomyces olivoverticillatus]